MERTKILRVPNHELQNRRAVIEKEELCARQWQSKWGFLLPLYEERYKGRRRLVETSRPVRELILPDDHRSVKPFPKKSSEEVGWISTRPEFNLEIHGPYFVRIPLVPPETWEDLDD